MTEQQYERLLQIETAKPQQGFPASVEYHRYEPTPYEALDLLRDAYPLAATDTVVDFGSGKGRLPFYLAYTFRVRAIGVEMDGGFHEAALDNWINYSKKHHTRGSVQLIHDYAERFTIPSEANRFYFFNPFSVNVFRDVVSNIIASVERSPRPVDLILYYPADEYLHFLNDETPFQYVQGVRLPLKNLHERFLIYRFDMMESSW
ncbi:SAM-dependent methyltransferase [Exiguobacterium alkaliphilum]|uniref:SAM-dependent methyltransferase n=1 Tax=Exiguobacterium alkaliphilum TaxID=1428684 RepID=A0ABT2KTQ0_9BACL|nr:SAM-dependent methyltransferase [Exiguobacterium alkaliphilum]MCT4794352.1 SAM-dependent methyltransferase [Exiguobacterium alkaliphilum]